MRALAFWLGVVTAIAVSAQVDRHLITESAVGSIRLGMTLAEARDAADGATFARTTDGDGAALVEVSFGKDDSLILYAAEDDPADPIAWSKKIEFIEAFSPAFHTVDGIHPGSRVVDVSRRLGPVREIDKSEIEGRQFITFARQPSAFTFRIDYTGVFALGARETTRFQPNAKIFSIGISASSAR